MGKLTKSQTIGVAVGCSVAGLALALGLGLGLGLKGKDEGGEEAPAPEPTPQPTAITTYACDPRSGTQYMCSLKEGGPFTAETCDTSDPNCKPCKCVMPVTTVSSTGVSSCTCGYSDAAYKDSNVPKYNTLSQCGADATQKCGWKYGCDCNDPSEFKCSLKQNGEWGSQQDCRCFCEPEGQQSGDENAPMGWKCDMNSTSPSGCSYVAGGPYATEEECRCFYAQGASGTNCQCVRTESNLPASEPRAFNTLDKCKSDTTLKCGWLYGCDDNNARSCSLKKAGTWTMADQCVCGPPNLKWSCDPTSAYASKCVQVADDTGQYASQAECRCFSCDAASTSDTKCSPVARGAKGTFYTQPDCTCIYAAGAAGPDCQCKYDSALTASTPADKKFHNLAECNQDWRSKCGWKYKCATYGTILQCADMNNQYYLVDGSTDTLRLLTDAVALTYDPNYKANATYTDCAYHNLTVGEPAQPKA